MFARHRRALPIAVVRDLLGITRGLYRAERANPVPNARRLAALQEAGEHLKLALDLGRSPPDTMGGRAAWSWAERAAGSLAALVVEGDVSIAAAVHASVQRLQR